jgi:hypothetical protein
MEKRKQMRFTTRFDALYSTGPAEGVGTLMDLSYSGALLEGVSQLPEVGTEVRLFVFVQPVAPFELVGHVVRCTDSGFAIEYDVDDPEVRSLVDDVSALVSPPGS